MKPMAQPARLPARGAAGGAHGLVGGPQQAAAVFQEHPARRGQRDVVPVALQQRRADLLLQLADLHAQGGLGDVEAFRCPAEVQFLGRGDEVTEVAQFHR